jgi:alkyl sulfatase BDS1-like metallo-beta-lactamase superfamily hydrolase
MSTEQWLNFLGIKLDSRKAGDAAFTINLATPDNGERFVIELAHGTLTNIQGYAAPDANLGLTLNRGDLSEVMSGAATFEALMGAGKVEIEGDMGVLGQLAGMMGTFDPLFEIMPGTKVSAGPEDAATLEAIIGNSVVE